MRTKSTSFSISNDSSVPTASASTPRSISTGSYSRNFSSSYRTNTIARDICNCGPDLYTKVLGPTADETILVGIKSIINNIFADCTDGDGISGANTTTTENIQEEKTIIISISDDTTTEGSQKRVTGQTYAGQTYADQPYAEPSDEIQTIEMMVGNVHTHTGTPYVRYEDDYRTKDRSVSVAPDDTIHVNLDDDSDNLDAQTIVSRHSKYHKNHHKGHHKTKVRHAPPVHVKIHDKHRDHIDKVPKEYISKGTEWSTSLSSPPSKASVSNSSTISTTESCTCCKCNSKKTKKPSKKCGCCRCANAVPSIGAPCMYSCNNNTDARISGTPGSMKCLCSNNTAINGLAETKKCECSETRKENWDQTTPQTSIQCNCCRGCLNTISSPTASNPVNQGVTQANPQAPNQCNCCRGCLNTVLQPAANSVPIIEARKTPLSTSCDCTDPVREDLNQSPRQCKCCRSCFNSQQPPAAASLGLVETKTPLKICDCTDPVKENFEQQNPTPMKICDCCRGCINSKPPTVRSNARFDRPLYPEPTTPKKCSCCRGCLNTKPPTVVSSARFERPTSIRTTCECPDYVKKYTDSWIPSPKNTCCPGCPNNKLVSPFRSNDKSDGEFGNSDAEMFDQYGGKMAGDAMRCEVRYAITKITKFYSYTTFEVMKATKKKPKVMPTTLEGVFVLKNKRPS